MIVDGVFKELVG